MSISDQIIWKWEDFKPDEVLSPDGLKFFNKGNLKLQGFALDNLQEFRKYLNLGIIVNSGNNRHRGYRSEKENKNLKGAVPNSTHTQGIAFDTTPSGAGLFSFYVTALTWSWLRLKLKKDSKKNVELGFRGFGIYKNSNFCHFDCRTIINDVLVIWNGDTGKTAILDALIMERSIVEVRDYVEKELGFKI